MSVGIGPFVRKELREILRDRRTILLAFVVPIFVYPATFSFTSFLERHEEERAAQRVLAVAVTGDASLADAVAAAEGLALADELPGGGQPDSLRAAVRDGDLEAWVEVASDSLRIAFHAPRESSRDARDRLEAVVDEVRTSEATRRWRAAGGEGPLGAPVGVAEIDVASAEEAGGATAGKLVPFLLVVTLFIGGSALSTDIVAGEKERGTLETLYLTPVGRAVIARAKFVLVAAATVVSGILNFASLLLCYRLGWIGDGGGLSLSGGGIATTFLLIAPLGALVGGLLLGISAFARSLREAQFYLMPVMFVSFVPGLLATSQAIVLDPFTALIPVTNVALAVRDGLVGPVSPGLLALVGLAAAGWAALALRWTAGVLSREETILGFDPEPFLARTRAGRERAALLGMAGTVLGFFYAGQWIQSRDPIVGLAASLWILLPLLGALTLRLAWSGGTLREVLSLRRPSLPALLGGALVGAGLVVPLVHGVARLQGIFLPVPEDFTRGLEDVFESLSTPALLGLVAASPGVCEELVFRGAFFGLLRRVVPDRRAAIVSAAFFGAIHLSVFRFLPTFLIGLVLAGLVRRSRSLFPAMLAHAVYNGVTVLGADEGGMLEDANGLTAWAASAALLAAGAWLAGRRRPAG